MDQKFDVTICRRPSTGESQDRSSLEPVGGATLTVEAGNADQARQKADGLLGTGYTAGNIIES